MRICLPILLSVMPPAYQCGDNDLFALAALKALKAVVLSLKHGNTADRGYSFMLYGMMIGRALGQHREGRSFGDLGLEILKRYNDPDMNGRALGTFGAMVHPWTSAIRASYPVMRDAYEYDLQAGNSGAETLRALRSINRNTPVLISSGNARLGGFDDEFAAVVGYLQKPFTMVRLSEHVAQALKGR